jgi:hypothetical protein
LFTATNCAFRNNNSEATHIIGLKAGLGFCRQNNIKPPSGPLALGVGPNGSEYREFVDRFRVKADCGSETLRQSRPTNRMDIAESHVSPHTHANYLGIIALRRISKILGIPPLAQKE